MNNRLEWARSISHWKWFDIDYWLHMNQVITTSKAGDKIRTEPAMDRKSSKRRLAGG